MPSKPVLMDLTFIKQIGNNYSTPEVPDLFGIEIELEGRNLYNPTMEKYWTKHNDGSLRTFKHNSQALEYVLRYPSDLKLTEFALHKLYEYLNSPGVEVFDSYRTSIHVHINCLMETTRTIANFITLAIIFDELFVSQNGNTRIGNNFCLRTRDAEGQIQDLIRSVTRYGSFLDIHSHYRYASVNFSSLLKFGTIEFRSLECTTDLNRVLDWIKVIQGLKEKAREYNDPREIIAKFSRKGPIGFMLSHLGDQFSKYSKVDGCQNMIRNGMRLAQDFAFCSDWIPASLETSEPTINKIRPPKHWNMGVNIFDPEAIAVNIAPPQEQPFIEDDDDEPDEFFEEDDEDEI